MATFQEMIGTVIPEKLREIETREQVKILHCVESGSRAWGFESPDSDYDVRFVYVRRPEHYLRLDRPRDVIEWQLDETLDINGWDLQKALRLLHGSNPTLLSGIGRTSSIGARRSGRGSPPRWDASFLRKPGFITISTRLGGTCAVTSTASA